MIRILEYRTSFVTPSDDEIEEAIEIAREKQCIVRIHYFLPYYGSFHLDVEPCSTFDECYSRIHNPGDTPTSGGGRYL